jgi:sporulation protein YlmC with PRC-barrel domain
MRPGLEIPMSGSADVSAGPDQAMTLALGAPVSCRDGELGELADVVLDPDPEAAHVTHVVVEPHHHKMLSPRLVPMALVEPGRDHTSQLVLRCTQQEFDALDPVRRFASVPMGAPEINDPEWDVGKINAVSPAPGIVPEAGAASYLGESTVAYDRVPKYEIELGRTSPVRSRDDHHLGHVVALTVDGAGRLTRFVVEHRHLWRRRRIEVPVDAVEEIGTDLVMLRLTRREARRLPVDPQPVG